MECKKLSLKQFYPFTAAIADAETENLKDLRTKFNIVAVVVVVAVVNLY